MKKKFILTFGLLITMIVGSYSQNEDGYWDYEHVSYKQFTLCAGCRTWYRVGEIPVGTTELIYRITLLNENQELSSNLVSVLKAVPDPSGISKGSAGAIAILSKISGSDKCKYMIFTSNDDAQTFYTNGTYENCCYYNSNEISKDAGRLSLSSSTCLQNSPQFLWFGFKSSNMLLNEKIVIEAVPWVDKKASRGWSLEVKQSFIDKCKSADDGSISDMDKFCQCFLDKLQENYKMQDFQDMVKTEKDKVLERFYNECLSETGELANNYDKERAEAIKVAKQGNYGEAIIYLLDVINNGKPTVIDYNDIGYCYIFTKQYLKSIKYLKIGEALDESELLIKGNLAHAYLFNGDLDLAKSIYAKYKTQNVTETMSWVDMVKSDFDAFKKAGLPTDNFELILNLIK